jgi:hypothetical protein
MSEPEITINPNNGAVSVDGEPLTPEQHKELWEAMKIEVQREIDRELVERIVEKGKPKFINDEDLGEEVE